MSVNDRSLAAVAALIAESLGARLDPAPKSSVHGGCINESYRWMSADGPLFVKTASASLLDMLDAEAAGLRELAAARAVRVPQVIACGATEGLSFLALEWIDLVGSSGKSQARLGAQLAAQHRVVAGRFGWGRDNTIGSTAQINAESDDWAEFFRERRLRFQLELAARNGHGGRLQQRGERLLEHVGDLFAGHCPAPSLLHGDLWGGNAGSDAEGSPVIFDPAVYFGDRETDIAMTRLFGGFSAAFYSAYDEAWPLPDSAKYRVEVYNLYHVLNHLNLFGASYRRQAEDIIDRQLTAAGH